jgi:hypothetical protein
VLHFFYSILYSHSWSNRNLRGTNFHRYTKLYHLKRIQKMKWKKKSTFSFKWSFIDFFFNRQNYVYIDISISTSMWQKNKIRGHADCPKDFSYCEMIWWENMCLKDIKTRFLKVAHDVRDQMMHVMGLKVSFHY